MVLSDSTIREEISAGRIAFDPFDPDLIQPSSVDMRADGRFRVFHNSRYPFIDVRQPMDDLTELIEVREGEPFILHPGEFVLGQTLERVKHPEDLEPPGAG
jgi:dCTP deaminase